VVILMVIQTIRLAPPEPNGTEGAAHMSRVDPTGANQSETGQPPTDLAVGVRLPRGALTSRFARQYGERTP